MCEGRIEVMGRSPLVIIDAAHNPASARALANTLAESPVLGSRWLILATTRGKDVPGMLRFLLPQFDHVICTRYQKNPRSCDVNWLLKTVNDVVQADSLSIQAQRCDHPLDAWRLARDAAQPDDCICVTGSFFIAAEFREIL
jgi:dihydrofolate synthase/folylpolyglutamate synthase